MTGCRRIEEAYTMSEKKHTLLKRNQKETEIKTETAELLTSIKEEQQNYNSMGDICYSENIC